jgi:hypothetical protein
MRAVFFKHARRRKFTQLVADHVLGDENGNEGLPVVNQKRVADKIRRHHRATRPSFDWFLPARVVHLVDLFQKMRLDEGSFLQRSSHKIKLLFATPLQNEAVTRLVFCPCFESFGELSPRTHRMMPAASAFRFTLTTPHGMIDRVHGHPAYMRPPPLPTAATGLAAGNIHVIDIAHLADRRVSVLVDAANFA